MEDHGLLSYTIHNHYHGCWWRGDARSQNINTFRPRQNGRHFPDDIFKCIFLNENDWIPTEISLKFVPQGPINNVPALVKIMAWRRPSDKPLSGPMMPRLPTHICVTRPQWVNSHGVDLVPRNTHISASYSVRVISLAYKTCQMSYRIFGNFRLFILYFLQGHDSCGMQGKLLFHFLLLMLDRLQEFINYELVAICFLNIPTWQE